jgi:hypothetical protein
MSRAVECFLDAARIARHTAAQCLVDAKAASPARAFRLIAEHDECIDRAEDYEMRASWYAPKIKLEIAA